MTSKTGKPIIFYLVTLGISILLIVFLHRNKADMNQYLVAVIGTVVVLLMLVGFLVLAGAVTKDASYRCPVCEEKITPSKKTCLIGFKWADKCYLKCPNCQKYHWCQRNH